MGGWNLYEKQLLGRNRLLEQGRKASYRFQDASDCWNSCNSAAIRGKYLLGVTDLSLGQHNSSDYSTNKHKCKLMLFLQLKNSLAILFEDQLFRHKCCGSQQRYVLCPIVPEPIWLQDHSLVFKSRYRCFVLCQLEDCWGPARQSNQLNCWPALWSESAAVITVISFSPVWAFPAFL